MRQRLDFVRAGFDGGFLDVRIQLVRVRLDEAHVLKQKLVAPRRTELALFEKHPDLRRRAVVVVREHLHDQRDLVRRVALENDVLHHHLLIADARALFDRPLNGVARHGIPPRLFHGCEQPRIGIRIRPAELRSDSDFLGEFADSRALAKVRDFPFCLEPLTSHSPRFLNTPAQNVNR